MKNTRRRGLKIKMYTDKRERRDVNIGMEEWNWHIPQALTHVTKSWSHITSGWEIWITVHTRSHVLHVLTYTRELCHLQTNRRLQVQVVRHLSCYFMMTMVSPPLTRGSQTGGLDMSIRGTWQWRIVCSRGKGGSSRQWKVWRGVVWLRDFISLHIGKCDIIFFVVVIVVRRRRGKER